jgi:hypothetical protein
MDSRHKKDDDPAGPGRLTGPAVEGPCAVNIQTDFGGSPSMERLEPGGGPGAVGGNHKYKTGINARMIAVRIRISWDTEQTSHLAASPFRI